jgi:AbrB family looped-hinge helix DNA binding protein
LPVNDFQNKGVYILAFHHNQLFYLRDDSLLSLLNLNIHLSDFIIMSKIIELKVGRKGQIIIPKKLREEFNIKEGGKILVKKVDGKILLIPKPEDPVEYLLKIAQNVRLGDIRSEVKEFRRDMKRELS